MATKERCLVLKNDHQTSDHSNSDSQYQNINLNQFHNGSEVNNIQSESITNKSNPKLVNEVKHSDTFTNERKNNSWATKTHKPLEFNNFTDAEKVVEKHSKENKTTSTSNSTLSLHIAAYENSVEVADDAVHHSDENEEVSAKKSQNKALNKMQKCIKQLFSTNCPSATIFEIPRQQEDASNNTPEIMQFKASQKLLNPYDASDESKGTKKKGIKQLYSHKMAKNKRFVEAESEATSDDDNNDEIYDEVDKFHQSRDKEILGNLNTEKKYKRRETEVLGVVASSESDEEDYDSDDSDDSVDERLGKKKAAGNDESGIKSADAWGKQKLAYYGSHADKDFGGWNSDEAEALELEEEDAITRQKKLDAGIEAVDFAGLLASDDEEQQESSAVVATRNKKDQKDKTGSSKFEAMSKKKQAEYMEKHSASFDQFVQEYNKRKAQFEELKPMLDSILLCMNDHKCPFTTQIKAIIAAYTQYLQSYLMFFYLKETTPVESFKLVENHPVLDDIMKQYPIIKEIDDFIENNYRRLMKVSDRLKADPSYAEVIAHPEPPKKKRRNDFASDDEEEMNAKPKEEEDIKSIFAKMASGKDKKAIKKVAPHGPALDDADEDEEGKKRKITYEMQKNKGLTVKRKKATSHSRTKKRSQFKKAIHKHRSQVPEVQREITKYDGERRGIRASTVRSIKLKA